MSKIRNRLDLAGIILMVVSMALTLSGSWSHGHDGPHKYSDAEAQKPSPLPDRINLCITATPSKSMAVNWRTDLSVNQGLVEIAVAQAGPMFIRSPRQLKAVSEVLKSDLSEARYHSVVMDQLVPENLYAYRVGDGLNWSEWFHFRAAPTTPKPFRFIYFGDAQNDVKSLWSRVIRSAFQDAPKAALLVHAGDLINSPNRDVEWGDWFEAAGFINGMMPLLATPGNHEYSKSPQGPALSKHWRPQFTFPTNGPAGLEETCYYSDYAGVRFVSLNSNERQQDQVNWLDSILANNPNRWTILTFHHPIYSAAKGRDNKSLREMWQPVFDKHKVDLVLTGHDHTYARSGLLIHDNQMTGTNVRDSKSGTVYVVSVSGPKMYRVDREEWMKRAAENTQLYQIIEVDGDRIRYESRTAIGTLYDAFELVKKPNGQPNELIDKIPNTPERLGDEVRTSRSQLMDSRRGFTR
ncbi:MAG: metallophosphoesterase family protein [Planctomycetota bacterium]|nr:metallophosphoesterase family protein [Planctomycetota bacterium]